MKIVPDVSDIVSQAEKNWMMTLKVLLRTLDISTYLQLSEDVIRKIRRKKLTASDKIDRVVTNRWLAPHFRCRYAGSLLCVGNHGRYLGH